MSIRILHTADWHIGKPFGRLPADQAVVLRRARLDAIDRLADAARNGGAQHVLVAGDIYDSPRLADRALREPIARLRAHADLTWHVIPGNHDHAGRGSAWERALRDALPTNVRLYLETRATEIAPAAFLLPSPLLAKSTATDPTAWMAGAPTPPGALRIGLAHGSISGFGSERQASVAIAADRARTAGLSYLALGDWHGTLRVTADTWYAGTPEPDGFLDNSPGHALLVEIEGERQAPVVTEIVTAEFAWLSRKVDMSRATDLDAVEAEVAKLGPAAGRTLLELDISGRLSLELDRALANRLDLLEPALFHLSRRLDNVSLAPAEDDIASLGDGALALVARDLAETAAMQASPDAGAAQLALRRLFELARATAEGAA